MRYADGVHGKGGRYFIGGIAEAKLSEWVTELALHAERLAEPPTAAAVHPRIALYKPFTASMDEGWTEWLLDDHGFTYSTITNTNIRAGDLGARFDVILMASDRARSITDGFAKGTVPPR